MVDCESVHRLLLGYGFRDRPEVLIGRRRWSVVAPPVDRGDSEVVVRCVLERAGGFHLRVSPAGARGWVSDVLEGDGAAGVPVRPDLDGDARGSWLAITVGIGAMALFAWSLFGGP
jgi:hypothetical protein